MNKTVAFAVAAATVIGLSQSVSAQTTTLSQVKARDALNCGSGPGLAGFYLPDEQGNWTGLDVDFCRAIAAAIFNDPNKVKFIPPVHERPLHWSPVRRGRRPFSQHHLDAFA